MEFRTFLAVCLVGVALYLTGRLLRKRRSHPPPPGPSGWPLIGNIFDLPRHRPWVAFAAMGRKYGPIISMRMLGTQYIILNSAKAVDDILEKRSSISSDRPHFTMGGDLVGWGKALIFEQYGERFRLHRKLFHRQMGSKTSLTAFHPVEEEETKRFLCNVLNNPDDLAGHVRRMAGAIILKISHGYSVKDGNDPFVEMADQAMLNFSVVSAPGGFLVDLIPVLRYLPEWFPGAGFQRDAKRWRKMLNDTATKPHDFVLEHLAKGDAVPSFASRLLQEGVTPEEEDTIKWASFSVYLGGSDTNVSSIYAFFLAMTMYPDVLKKAQAEVDAVVGSERLPTFEDHDSLPYINAICKEVLRWNVVAPLVIHATSQDDIYEGYLIPKGSVIIANTWHILYNEETYPEPEVFRPERFLGDTVQPEPRNACFGFGRRICPGRLFVEASMFISVAMSLATLDISRQIEDGIEVTPKYEAVEDIVCHPKPFKCKITARSKKVQDLLCG
ncbi:cytochrome P450 [Gyrodon lividus]|nr:cytochrome P450 [Gyrodon lividus]